MTLFILLNPIAPAAGNIMIQGTQNKAGEARRERRVRGGERANGDTRRG